MEINWVELLLEIAFMRLCMGYTDTDKEEQSLMYLLEHHMEICLEDAFPEDAKQILLAARHLTCNDHALIGQRLPGRSAYFLQLNHKNKRTSQLLWLIESLMPFFSDTSVDFDEYESSLYDNIDKIKW